MPLWLIYYISQGTSLSSQPFHMAMGLVKRRPINQLIERGSQIFDLIIMRLDAPVP